MLAFAFTVTDASMVRWDYGGTSAKHFPRLTAMESRAKPHFLRHAPILVRAAKDSP